jgi:tetrahydromethanopterin S-methyltransferase subunit B
MEEISLDTIDLKPTSDFGGGLEFLMNDKKKENVDTFSIEEELKELDSFQDERVKEIKPIRLNFDNTNDTIKIGKDTASIDTFEQSSTGFRHMNDIPVEEIKNIETKSKEEILKEKFTVLRKLEELETKGVHLSKHYTMDSSLDEMKGEYEHHISEKERKNSVQFQAKMLTTFITGIEFLNTKLNPFDIKLDGFSESINENIEDYDDIFSEIHEKYKGKVKMAPEIRLVFQLATAGMMVHMTNTLFKSAMPNMDDMMRQNPDIMNTFSKAAMQSMEKNAPGMNNFMNSFTSQRPQVQPVQQYQPPRREEMNGPGNINTILSGLNKKINLEDKNESIVSVEELDSIATNVSAVSKRGRRKSDKNNVEIII